MRFVTYQREPTLSELAQRAFEIKGPKAKTLTAQAEAEILRANPHLRDLHKVAEGTLVLVPDVPGLKPGEIQRVPGLGSELVAHLNQALADAGAALERSAESEAKNAENTLTLIKSREMKEAIKQTPDLKDRLGKVADAAKARAQEAETTKKAGLAALAQLKKDLGNLTL